MHIVWLFMLAGYLLSVWLMKMIIRYDKRELRRAGKPIEMTRRQEVRYMWGAPWYFLRSLARMGKESFDVIDFVNKS